MSLTLEGQNPRRLCVQEQSDELRTLANVIAEYAGVTVSSVDPLDPNAGYNRVRFQKVERRMIGWSVIFIILGGIGWAAGLTALGHWRAALFMEAPYLIVPSSIIWAVPAILLGIVTGVVLLDRFQRHSLKSDYADYVSYEEKRNGLTEKMSWYFVFGPLIVLSLVFTIMALDWYLIFTDREVVINPLFGFSEEQRPYASIVGIKTAREYVAPNGNRIGCREFVIFFADGTHWSSLTTPSGMTESGKRAVIDYASIKSGIPIQEVEFLSRDEVS